MRWPIASGIVTTVLNASTATAGSTYVAGFAVNPSDELQVDTAAGAATDVWVAGIRCKADGIVRVSTGAIVNYNGGLPVDANGFLVVEAGGTPDHFVAGIPLNASHAVCVSAIA